MENGTFLLRAGVQVDVPWTKNSMELAYKREFLLVVPMDSALADAASKYLSVPATTLMAK